MPLPKIPPKLPRNLDWTSEKVTALDTPGLRALHDNAVRLGETEVAALCEAAMDARPHGRRPPPRGPRQARSGSGRKLVSRSAAVGMRGATLVNRFWSRSGLREDGAVVFTLWADDVRYAEGVSSCLLWAPNADGARPWSDTPGGQERLEHCRLALARGTAEGVLIYGVRAEGVLPEERVQQMHGADAENTVDMAVAQRGEEFWASWGRSSAA